MTTPTEEPDARAWGPGRILAVAVALVLVLFWIWVFAGGPKKHNPDYLSDRAWAERAEQVCVANGEAIAKLPGAETTPSNVERAKVVGQANVLLAAMVERLGRPLPTDAEDAKLVRSWLGDYRNYVASREDYAARLAKDKTARLLLNEKFNYPIDDVIGTFADVNDMPTCEVPGDVG